MRNSITSLQSSAPNRTTVAERVRPSDREEINAFIDFSQSKGLTRKTTETYRSAAEGLAAFAADRGMPALVDIRREHIEDYLGWYRQKGNKPASVKNRHSGIRAFFNWTIHEDLRHDHPMERIAMPRVPDQVLPYYSEADVLAVLNEIPNKLTDGLGLRDRAIILFFYDTGVRCQELCDIRIGDLDREARHAEIVSGKGGKGRVVAYSADVANALNRMMRTRGGWETAGRRAPLFATRDGQALTTNGIRMLMHRRFGAAGVEFRGTHAFRRSAGIGFLENGGDPTDLKELMGWSSWSMLTRYTKATARQRALKSHVEHSPVSRLMQKDRRR